MSETPTRWFNRALLVAVIVSVMGHFAIARILDELPPHERAAPPRRIEVRVVEPPPPPLEPEPEPPPAPVAEATPPPPRVVPDRPQPLPPVPRKVAPAAPTPEAANESTDAPSIATTSTTGSGAPVFGVSMESTSQGGTASAPVGNTSAAAPATGRPAGAAAAGPAAAHEVTKMPMPQGRCSGAYTNAARQAGIEGVVVLDLVVDETGRARDIRVIERLEHGLTEAAVTTLTACRFTPGEQDGKAVAVRVRGFKIRFVLGDDG